MKKFLLTHLLLIHCLNSNLEAKIYVDYESDPLPLVKINILAPSTRMTSGDTENLGLRFLEEFYESGTLTLTRQKLQDSLASYGASLEISPGYEYAEISTTFPLNGGKIPKGLPGLIQDSWNNPRITKENFERAKKFLKSNHMSLLDRDAVLLNLGLQKLMATALFGLTPYSTETFSKIKLADIQNLHKNYYNRSGDIWVGAIGPAELKKDTIEMIKGLFPQAGAVEEGLLKEKLVNGYKPVQKGLMKPTFLIIDKKDLAQIHYGFLRIAQATSVVANELKDNFNYYVLAGMGIDSIFGKRIRGDKGLAYSVSGMMGSYYDYPVISLYANPQRDKQAIAFEVLNHIISDTFTQSRIISSINEKSWNGWLASYKNSERQSGITPEGRIERRKSIATGDLSYSLYNTPIDNWSIKKSVAASRLLEISNSSSMLLAAIGDAKEIDPLVKKYFADYEILNISYKDVLSENWLKKKN